MPTVVVAHASPELPSLALVILEAHHPLIIMIQLYLLRCTSLFQCL